MKRKRKGLKMNWNEFKTEWKKLDKKRKNEIIAHFIGIVLAAVLIIFGCNQMTDYLDKIPSDQRYAIGGAFIAATGYFCFWYFCWKYHCGRFSRLEDRIEKLEGVDDNENQ